MHHDICEWAEVTSAVTEFCGVSNIIFRAIAGVCHPTSASQRLSDHIERCHTQPWREIDRCLIAHSRRHHSADCINHLAVCTANVNCDTCNAQRIDQQLGVCDIFLPTIRHQHTDNPLCAKGFNTKCCDYATIFATGNTDNSTAVIAVCSEIFSNPLHDFIFCSFRICQHTIPLSSTTLLCTYRTVPFG